MDWKQKRFPFNRLDLSRLFTDHNFSSEGHFFLHIIFLPFHHSISPPVLNVPGVTTIVPDQSTCIHQWSLFCQIAHVSVARDALINRPRSANAAIKTVDFRYNEIREDSIMLLSAVRKPKIPIVFSTQSFPLSLTQLTLSFSDDVIKSIDLDTSYQRIFPWLDYLQRHPSAPKRLQYIYTVKEVIFCARRHQQNYHGEEVKHAA